MFFKKENLYLFLALTLIISTNLYLTYRLIPKKEGFNVKKEIDKLGKSIEKDILNKVTDLIKNTLIKQPINAIPYKPLRKFFLDNVNFDKDLGTVIQQLLYTIVKAIMTILVMVPIIYWVVTTSAIPMIINALNTVIIQIYSRLLTKPSLEQPIMMGDSISGRGSGSCQGKKPDVIVTGKTSPIPSDIRINQKPVPITNSFKKL